MGTKKKLRSYKSVNAKQKGKYINMENHDKTIINVVLTESFQWIYCRHEYIHMYIFKVAKYFYHLQN